MLSVNAGMLDDPQSYRAALILDGWRIRGVDFSLIDRMRFYQAYIRKGWHENMIDPSLSTTDKNQNRHVPLENFEPIDLEDFLGKICQLWHIDLVREGGLL